MKRIATALALVSFVVAGRSDDAGNISLKHGPIAFYAILSGANEISSKETSHSGSGTFLLASNSLSYSLSFDADFHATSGGVFGSANPMLNSKRQIAGLNVTNAAEDGTYNGTISLRQADFFRLLTGQLYVNLASEQFPNGELRGMIFFVDTPQFVASLAVTNRHASVLNPGDDDIAQFEVGSGATWFYVPDYFFWSNATVEIIGPLKSGGGRLPDIPIVYQMRSPTNPGPGESGLCPMTDEGMFHIMRGKVSVNVTIPGTPTIKASILPEDTDGNGVPDYVETYLEQICPCEADWKDHKEYVSSVRNLAMHFASNGIITWSEARAIVKHADESTCGQKL